MNTLIAPTTKQLSRSTTRSAWYCRCFLFSILALGIVATAAAQSTTGPWVLSNEQRRAFLHHYSPVILKRANENDNRRHLGHDWITNFTFDNDLDFGNNRKNWRDGKIKFIKGTANLNWAIKPTIYTALVEWMTFPGVHPSSRPNKGSRGRKSLVLIYHIYHAYQGGGDKTTDDIHDWERIELRLDNVSNRGPGHGEQINYTVITNHKKHFGRLGRDSNIKFVDSTTTKQQGIGKHLIVSQQKWNGTNWRTLRKAELRYVEDDLESFFRGTAAVRINGRSDRRPFHYIFADGSVRGLRQLFATQSINSRNAASLASGKDDDKRIRTAETKRINYELRDIASILPTHWCDPRVSGSPCNERTGNSSWVGPPSYKIALSEPVHSTLGGVRKSIPRGTHTFLLRARDGTKGDGRGDRKGYPDKGWFWGTYDWGKTGNWTDKEYTRRRGRWNQHAFFVHEPGMRREKRAGTWLPPGWNRPDRGGFDGRWIELFPENVKQIARPHRPTPGQLEKFRKRPSTDLLRQNGKKPLAPRPKPSGKYIRRTDG